MASAEDKNKIATYLIMNSPPGEVGDVARDVSKVLKDKDFFKSTTVSKILKDYNIKMMTPSRSKDGRVLCTTKAGLVSEDPDTFLDPRTGETIQFNHLKERWSEAKEGKSDLDGAIADQKAAIQKEMDAYAEKSYVNSKCVSLVYGNNDGTITVCVSARDLNLSNFWTGSWRGLYTFNCKTKGKVGMTSATNVIVHYFEDGNVQLHSEVKQEVKIEVGSPEETASAVAVAVAKIENAFHEALEKMYADMHQSTFKTMRRFLPPHRQRMNWDIKLHEVTEELLGPSM